MVDIVFVVGFAALMVGAFAAFFNVNVSKVNWLCLGAGFIALAFYLR